MGLFPKNLLQKLFKSSSKNTHEVYYIIYNILVNNFCIFVIIYPNTNIQLKNA